ncbi:cation:proton antiporter [Geomonas ferrireducens]|uniref:cation:proton antiporter n=1 Tax=Geomonas ferrireducens TaxID=2570227 RepID=UPI0013A5DF1F|nr:monovalent cation/H(+) antiporter subunit G [Geomonas ferrireducens]
MSPDLPAGAVVIGLLVFALLVCTFSCAGVAVMKGVYAKLHYLSPPAVLAAGAMATAITIQEGMSAPTIKAWLVFAVMVVGNPVITFAAARAHYLREAKDVKKPTDDQGEEDDHGAH